MKNAKSAIIWTTITLLSIVLVVFLCDSLTYLYYKKIQIENCKKYKLPYLYRYSLMNKSGLYDKNNTNYRKPRGTQYKKPPIYLFGCSFAYGQYLEEDKIFSSLLSDMTKRPVYNKAVIGGNFAHMYYQLVNHKIDFKNTKPDYIIYIMIEDHTRRINADFFGPLDCVSYLRYKNINNKLVLTTTKTREFPALYLYKAWSCSEAFKKAYYDINGNDEVFDLIKLYLISSKHIINQESPKTKFILMLYDDINKNFWFFNSPRLKELKKEGIIIVKASNFSPKPLDKMKRADCHPTEEAWEIITPNFIKLLNL